MSKDRAIAQFAPIFSQYGYDGATLTRLSQASGLGKASLYHHFRGGKEEMAAAVLEQFNQRFEATVLAALNAEGAPRDRLQAMATKLGQFYMNGHSNCLLSVLSIGNANDLFRDSLQKVMTAWIAAITQVLVDAHLPPALAQQRSEEAVLLVEGALVVARVLGTTNAFDSTLSQLPDRLLRATSEV